MNFYSSREGLGVVRWKQWDIAAGRSNESRSGGLLKHREKLICMLLSQALVPWV